VMVPLQVLMALGKPVGERIVMRPWKT
jgi:hypothetical protein